MKPAEVKALYLRDFHLMQRGYQARLEKETNLTRHIMAYIKVFSGMGSSETVQVSDIWPLPMDNADVKRPVTTNAGAVKLLGEFYEALKVMSN